MLGKALNCAVIGLEGAIVEVEVDIAQSLPYFGIVGLPDAAVQGSKVGLRAAICNSCGNVGAQRGTRLGGNRVR